MRHTAFYVYLLKTTNGRRTYIGYTYNLEKRLAQHNGLKKGGARSTRGKQWEIVTSLGPFGTRSDAQKVEWAWKRRKGLSNRITFVM